MHGIIYSNGHEKLSGKWNDVIRVIYIFAISCTFDYEIWILINLFIRIELSFDDHLILYFL